MSGSAGSAGAPTLAVEDLSISYRRRRKKLPAVSGASFQIAPGEAYGLVGESGCGKTTIAMALMRYLPSNATVDSGTIRFLGSDMLEASQATLRGWRGNRIAMVYQDPGSALNPSARVGTQVAEVYRVHRGMSRSESLNAAAEMFDKVRFTDPKAMLGRYPHELSGGQQQRVMIAMALAADPALLVLDEPTTGLDATVEAEVLDLIEQLRAEYDTSVLFISHNLGIVARLCDRVGVLYAGRLAEEGPAGSVLIQPRHPYTSALLRCVPRPGMRKDTLRLEPIPGYLPRLGEAPPGCPFAPRCPLVKPECEAAPPPLVPVADGGAHSSACLRAADVPRLTAESSATEAPAPATAPAANGAPANGDARPVVAVDDLVKRYRSAGADVTAVDGVSLDIAPGETFGLVGESGSGKTTLARCVAGLMAPTGGTITVATNGGGRLARARFLQMVFQNPDTALNPRHVVRRILGRAQKRQGDPATAAERGRRLGDLISAVRLQDWHLDVRPAALSGGMKQRVAIARAFAGNPAVVLCDEPVSALDVSVQAAILNLLVDLQEQRGVSYLFISHDLAVVRYLADRIGVMYHGRIVDVGPAGAVATAPHHPYTEALLSAAPAFGDEKARERIRLAVAPGAAVAGQAAGCPFHGRCHRSLGEVCATETPPWQDDESGNTYRCHIPPAELRALQEATAGEAPRTPRLSRTDRGACPSPAARAGVAQPAAVAHPGGPVVARFTSSGAGSATTRSAAFPPSSTPISARTAARPSSYRGIRTVVSGGEVYPATQSSWMAMTDSSPGTLIPSSRAAPSTPNAALMFATRTAVGLGRARMSSASARCPSSGMYPKSRVHSAPDRRPAARSASWNPSSRRRAVVDVRSPEIIPILVCPSPMRCSAATLAPAASSRETEPRATPPRGSAPLTRTRGTSGDMSWCSASESRWSSRCSRQPSTRPSLTRRCSISPPGWTRSARPSSTMCPT
ncbi:MAG: dipeptide ABC transporter ATP-binding protein [Nocardiopsaceae bacterium]|nr:dipeptide ABC transporter ATP-binding protein [Nocardiopsaceae bacterium]